MTKKKRKISKNIVIGLGSALLLLVVLFSPVVRANVSILDRVAMVAGQVVGDKLVEQINELSDSEDGLFGSFVGSGRLYAPDGFTVGGRTATTSAAGITAYTVEAKDFKTLPTYYDWLNNDTLTLTLNATSVNQYVPNIGDVSKIYFRNASTTAASAITFAAEDAGLDLQYATNTSSGGTTSGDLTLNGLDYAELTIIREDTYTTSILFNEYQTAD